jgi:hypothetical protein
MVQSFWDRPSPVLTQQELEYCKSAKESIRIRGVTNICPFNGNGCYTKCKAMLPALDINKTCPCGSQYKPLHLIRVLNKLIRENTYRLNKTKGD